MIRFPMSLLILAIVTISTADEPKAKTEAKPQCERLLKGEDAKNAEELAKSIARLEAAGKRDEALKVAEELLGLRKKLQGDDHWKTVNATIATDGLRQRRTPEQDRQLAESSRLKAQMDTLYRQGKAKDAIPLAGSVHEIRSRVLGEKHSLTASSLNDLAGMYYSQKKYAETEPLYRDVLKIKREVLGEKHRILNCSHPYGSSRNGRQAFKFVHFMGPNFRTRTTDERAETRTKMNHTN